jgi:serine protease Do
MRGVSIPLAISGLVTPVGIALSAAFGLGIDAPASGAAATTQAASTEAASIVDTRPGDSVELYRAEETAFRAAAGRVAPCVVTIETIGGTQPSASPAGPATAPAGGPRRPREAESTRFVIADGPATGIVYSADGLILTSSSNFARDPSLITVVLPDGRRFVAELLARDEVRQLAMIKIAAEGLPTPEWVASPGEVRVGQWALALGRGFGGKDCSLSAGIISGLNRQSGLAIGTDAKLSPANFGGPLIDLRGRVLGVAVPMGLAGGQIAGVELYDSGIGFAVPAWHVRKSAEALAVGHSLRRGLLGVAIERSTKGILRIAGVGEPSPAGRAGLQAGDEVVTVDGRQIKNYSELQRLMRPRAAGERVAITVRRNGKEIEATVVLGVPEDMGPIPAASQPATVPAPK